MRAALFIGWIACAVAVSFALHLSGAPMLRHSDPARISRPDAPVGNRKARRRAAKGL